MDIADVLNIMTVPDSPVQPGLQESVSLEAEENGDETTFSIVCTDEKAYKLFTGKYDIRGLNEFDDFTILSHSIKEIYDASGVLVRQTVTYVA